MRTKIILLGFCAIMFANCKRRTCTCKDVNGSVVLVNKTTGGSASAAQSDCDAKEKTNGVSNGLTCTLE